MHLSLLEDVGRSSSLAMQLWDAFEILFCLQEGFLLFYDDIIAEMLHIKIWIDASLESLST